MGRNGCEFSGGTIHEAKERSGFVCERCGRNTDLEGHHILPLWIAAEYFPQLSSYVLKSLENCQILCSRCHDRQNHTDDWCTFNSKALELLHMMGRDYF